MEKKYFNLYSFCKIIEGKDKYIICDFQKKNIKYIPYSLVHVLDLLSKKDFNIVKDIFIEDVDIFLSYINFLLKEKFGFFSNKKAEFIEIPRQWSSPEIINNSVIEYDFNHYDLNDVINQLEDLNCKFLEIRLLSLFENTFSVFKDIMNNCKDNVLRSIRIYIPFQERKTAKMIETSLRLFPKIEKIVFYDTPFKVKNHGKVIYIKDSINIITNSVFDHTDLIIDLNYYLESLFFSPYYNRKVTVDRFGNIKNCIKNNKEFGNVNNDKIHNIIEKENFQELWHASHDKILQLKDDELRYNKLFCNDMEKIDGTYFSIIHE